MTTTSATSQLAIIDITGADSTRFLQNQLTQDVAVWPDAQEVRRAAWCTVKGRVWATFYIWKIEDGFRLVIAQDLLDATVKRLRMYVLRDKVVVAPNPQLTLTLSTEPGKAMRKNEHFACLFHTEGNSFGLSWAAEPVKTAQSSWEIAHILSGTAWISAMTSEQFVPQAINYELTGGINFKKGCYPGQEIVARSQYLGKLRRRAAIVSYEGTVLPLLTDVFQLDIDDPVGRIILSDLGWALIECPTASLEAALFADGRSLSIQALPYPIVDVTA